MCQQRIARVALNQHQIGPGVVKDRTLFLVPQRHIDGNGDCPERAYGDEGFNKFRRVMQQEGDSVAAPRAERTDNLGHPQRLRTQIAIRDPAPAEIDRGRRRVVREYRVE